MNITNMTDRDAEDARNILAMIPGAVLATRCGCGDLVISSYENRPSEMIYPDYQWTEKKPLYTYVTQEVINVHVNPMLIPSLGCGSCMALKDIAEGNINSNETF